MGPAVSVRKILEPKETGIPPFFSTKATSRESQPPSGPIKK